MYKSNTEFIVIDAKATEPISTNVVFWSHDKGTAKLVFELKKDTIPQSLAEGTKVPVLLEFDSVAAENSRGKHTYFATIDDAINGIVSIVLEDNILGYNGRVDGSIYIELPDSRSLDTAGRFTFQIKRSPIDEDVPELEDYYWQGFNEIMEQYHKSISEIKLEAKQLLDDLTLDVNTAKSKVTALEKSITTATSNLNARVDEINKKIDENDVFTKAESSANVIDQIIGKESTTLTITLDLKNKVASSVVENPNKAYTLYGATSLMTPGSGYETPQSAYDQISILDNNSFTLTRSAINEPSQMLVSWNLLEIAKNSLGEKYFTINGATDKASKIELLRTKLSALSGTCIGFGSGPGGNKLNLASWRKTDGTWQYRTPHTNAVDTKISNTIGSASILAYIDDDGFYHNLIYAETCDGTTQSKISVNYVSAQFKLDISANEQIELMIAANHAENLATETEAAAGTDNTKTMTPLRTKQLLDSKLLNMVYPIGAVYLSVNSASPNTLFGGTWERYAKGRVLVGVDEDDPVLSTAGKQGGSANGVAEHTHITKLTTFRVTTAGSGTVNNLARSTDQGNAMTGEFGSVSSTGDNTDHKNWQPFETVYIWKRIA